jgi:hypothetical protein
LYENFMGDWEIYFTGMATYFSRRVFEGEIAKTHWNPRTGTAEQEPQNRNRRIRTAEQGRS